MKKCLFIVLSLISSYYVFAQSGIQERQGLFKGLQNAWENKDSLDIARCYRKIGISYIYESSLDSAVIFLNKGLDMARNIHSVKAQGAILNNLAECYSKQGRNDKALEAYEESASLFLSLPDSIAYAGVLINISAVYDEAGKAKMAIEKALQAIDVKESVGDSAQLAFYYNKVAELFKGLNSPKWKEYLMTAYYLSKNPDHTTFYTNITIFNNMGFVADSEGRLEDAIAYYDTAYMIAKKYNHIDGIETGLSNKASLYLKMGDYEKASLLYRQAVEAGEKGENVYRKTDNLINAGRLEIKLKHYSSAISYLRMANDYANEYDYPKFEQESYALLSEAYENTGQWELALKADRKSMLLKDSLEGLEIKAFLHELEIRYKSEKQAQQIMFLEKENLFNKKQKRGLAALLFTSVVLTITIIGLFYFRSRTLRQQKEMAEQKKEIYKLGQEKLRLAIDQKNRELSSLALKIAQKTEILSELKKGVEKDHENIDGLIKGIERQLNTKEDWEAFRFHFEEVHPEFFNKLKRLFPSLTPNEERLCAFIKLNLSTKKIAQLNNNTVVAVDKGRNRLRKKLGLSPDISIKDFLDTVQ